MEKFVIYALSGVMAIIFQIYCWYKLDNQKINLKDYKLYLIVFSLSIIGTINAFYMTTFLKIIIYTIILFATNYIFFLKDLKKSIVTTLLSQLIMMISEMVFGLLCMQFIPEGLIKFSSSTLGAIIVNLGVSFIFFIIIQFSFVNKFYKSLLAMLNKIKRNILIIDVVVLLVIASLFTTISYYKMPIALSVLINTFLIMIYAILMYKMFESRSEYRRVSDKYSISLSSLKEYEDMINNYRVLNHENKNQLLMIKSMLISKDKKITEYIDSIVGDKIILNENLMGKIAKIPEGGLRATIYTKMIKMDDQKIPYDIIISREIKTSSLIALTDDLTLNICKIISVYIDNAIDAVSHVKNKNIVIDVYKDGNNVCIAIKNRFKKGVDFSKLDNMGYTTKGKGHGYGLYLVKGIINRYNSLESKRMIDKNLFSQILIIKDVG